MGRRDRERVERIRSGDEQPFAVRALSNPVARRVAAVASKGAVLSELGKATTEEQIEVLGSVSPTKVGKAIMRKAPKQMDKGIRDFQKRGTKVTVDGLLEEVRTTPGFLKMCEGVGISYKWFEDLARERMTAHGIREE